MRTPTPGPWKVLVEEAEDEFGPPVFIESGSTRTVADLSGMLWDDEGKANARLIAAAPEMLVALNECAESLVCAVAAPPTGRATLDNCDCWACECATLARAAIAKAEGQS